MAEPLPMFVWVDSTGSWTDPHPGILLSWRRLPDKEVRIGRSEWQGWVIQAWSGGAPAHSEHLYVHQSWVDAHHLRVARAGKPKPDHSRYKPVNSDRPR